MVAVLCVALRQVPVAAPADSAVLDMGDLLFYPRDRPTNVLLVKANYWLTLH